MKLYNFVDYRQLKQCAALTERTRLFTGYLCNIKCKFCFYKDLPHVDIKDRIREQLAWGKAYGIKDWDISGGEPSLLPYWFELLKDMKDFDFRNIACITNGYKFSDRSFLKNSIDSGLSELLFSVHGSDEKTHDSLTGVKGSYKKLWKAIINAQNEPVITRINTVVTKDNYKNLPHIAALVNAVNPVAFNLLPFRLENTASKENVLQYKDAVPYIKQAIDILTKTIKIRVRYIPFCVMEGYEKYVAGYPQRMFDPYEWSEYCIRKFENARHNKDIPELDFRGDKWKLEIDAIHKSIKHVSNHSLTCLKCKYLKVCEGIWHSYANIWGIDEFKPILGEKTDIILQ